MLKKGVQVTRTIFTTGAAKKLQQMRDRAAVNIQRLFRGSRARLRLMFSRISSSFAAGTSHNDVDGLAFVLCPKRRQAGLWPRDGSKRSSASSMPMRGIAALMRAFTAFSWLGSSIQAAQSWRCLLLVRYCKEFSDKFPSSENASYPTFTATYSRRYEARVTKLIWLRGDKTFADEVFYCIFFFLKKKVAY